MTTLRPIIEEYASVCPPVGKPLAYGRAFVVRVPDEGLKLVFVSDEVGADGEPKLNVLLGWEKPAKARMGGRLNNDKGYYLIFAGGKKAAQRVADVLNAG